MGSKSSGYSYDALSKWFETIFDANTRRHCGISVNGFSEDKTGLATILQLFKDRIHLDVTAIELVELTNGNIDTQNIPLFVLKHKKQDKRNSCQKGMRGKSPISFVRSSKTIRLKAFRSLAPVY